MKRILFSLIIFFALQVLCGCAAKKVEMINTYDRKSISKLGNGEPVIIRPIVDKFLNDQAQNIVIKNNIFTHAYGLQFVGILKDSFQKNGYEPIITGNVLKNNEDMNSVIIEAKNNNSRYAIIYHLSLGKFDIKDHVASNVGKSLIPIAGAFVDKSATMFMSINIDVEMYDVEANKFFMKKNYAEEDAADYNYTSSNISEQIIKTRCDLYAKLVSNAISNFWNDFSEK